MDNLSLFKVNLPDRESLMPALEEILYSGYIGEGESVFAFEREFGEFIGNPNTLMFNSGTAALHTALHLSGVKPGDEVISTALTAEPTNIAIKICGAKVVWADVDPTTGNICPKSVAAKITNKTRAIMAVDYAGVPIDIEVLQGLATKNNIKLIQDAAHALGAKYQGKILGSHADYVAFSFQSIKHLTTVDGGALAIKNGEEVAAGKRFRWFGMERGVPRAELAIKEAGYKYHMNNVTATIGRVQLKTIQDKIDLHIRNGKFFDQAFSKINGVTPLSLNEGLEPSYWLYTLRAERRDALVEKLAEAGIASGAVHKRNDLHPVFAESSCDLPNLDQFYAELIHIPCGWWITEQDCERIVETIAAGW